MVEQSQIATRCDGVELVYNNHARHEAVIKLVNTYIFGYLIDAAPWLPDTIVTRYCTCRCCCFMSMAYVHLSVEM